MDPFTQTLLGALTAQNTMGRALGRRALLLGAVGGEIPDVDVFFDAWSDPALPFELHRHFTHSLLFIPIGALIATLPFLAFRSFRSRPLLSYAAATIGCATHALLDNCTSYGTHLLWPFVEHRTAWDSMSIIDPIFTGLLALGVVISLFRKPAASASAGGRSLPAALAWVCLLLALVYIGFGFLQHHRAAERQHELARSRGHEVESGRVMPTLGNVIVWRSVYEDDGRLYADALRISPSGETRVREGSSIRRFTAEDLPVALRSSERVRYVFEKFSDFATGMTARARDTEALVIGDMRYSMDTAGFAPIWGIALDASTSGDAARWVHPSSGEGRDLADLWSDLVAPSETMVPLAVVTSRSRR